MTPCFMTQRSLNNYYFLGLGFIMTLVLGVSPSHAQFRNNQDQEIVKDVLKIFGKECSLRSASDGDRG